MDVRRAYALGIVACLGLGAFLVVPEKTAGTSTVTVSRLSASGDDLVIAWSQSNDVTFSSYQVFIRASSDPSFGSAAFTTTDIQERACSISDYVDWQGKLEFLQPSSDYVVFVRDTDAAGYSDSVAQTMSTTQSTTVTSQSATGSIVEIAWNNPIYYGQAQGFSISFLGYDVVRKVGADVLYESQAVIVDQSTMTWADANVSPGQTYYYEVFQVDEVYWMSNATAAFLDYHYTNQLEVTTPSLTVLSPNGGEQLMAGTICQINWGWTGTIASVSISLYKSGALDSSVTSSAPNTGTYYWTVPSTQDVGSDYRISISSTDGTGVSDQSDGSFSVTGSLSLTSPIGGEVWTAGLTCSINWTSTGGGLTYVEIDLYKGGSFLSTITPSTTNDGTYEWTVPSNLAAGSNYSIRIDSTTYSTIANDSGQFSIVKHSKSLVATVFGNPDITGILIVVILVVVVGLILGLRRRTKPAPIAPVQATVEEVQPVAPPPPKPS